MKSFVREINSLILQNYKFSAITSGSGLTMPTDGKMVDGADTRQSGDHNKVNVVYDALRYYGWWRRLKKGGRGLPKTRIVGVQIWAAIG